MGSCPLRLRSMTSAESARPYIEKANATYPCLIDTEHVVAHRYGMINVSDHRLDRRRRSGRSA